MRGLHCILVLPGLLCGAAGLACRSPAEPRDESEALVTRVHLDRRALAPGDTVWITVTAANPTLSVLTYRGSSSCVLGFLVYGPDGALVYPRGGFCTADLATVAVPPREALTRTFAWTGERVEYEAGRRVATALPPGRYQVVGAVGPAWHARSLSPPAALEVLPAP